MLNKETKMIKIADIKVDDRKRPVDTKKLKGIMNSIQKVGLINPITVNLEFQLIAGNHRLEAFKALGKTEIRATIVDADELHTELIEIDENIFRKNLTKIEEAKQLARRKELYEQMHPEATKKAIAKKNLAKRNPCVLDNQDAEPVKTFVEDTAEKTGMSERRTQLMTQIGEKITPEAYKKIMGTALENKITALTKVAQAKSDEQLKVVDQELAKLNRPKRMPKKSIEESSVTTESSKQLNIIEELEKNDKAEKKVEETTIQAEPVNTVEIQVLDKELDIQYKVDFVLRKAAVDGEWLELPLEYDMDKNSYNNMVLVAKNYTNNLKKVGK